MRPHHLSVPDCSSSELPATHRVETGAELPFFSIFQIGGDSLWPSPPVMQEPKKAGQKEIRALPKAGVGSRDMDRRMKALTTKPDNLSSISRTHIVEGKNGIKQNFL